MPYTRVAPIWAWSEKASCLTTAALSALHELDQVELLTTWSTNSISDGYSPYLSRKIFRLLP